MEENAKKLVKQKCKHCYAKISSKIERLREHLKRCAEFIKLKQFSEEITELDTVEEVISEP